MQKNNNSIQESFEDLQFIEDGHIYLRNGRRLSSASSVVSKTYEKFDAEGVSGFIAAREGVSKSDILRKWENAAHVSVVKGNALHQIAEDVANCLMEEYPVLSLLQFLLDLFSKETEEVRVAGAEVRLYSEEFDYAGTADLLVEENLVDHDTGEITSHIAIYDYKTNKDLYKNYRGKRMLAPFEEMLDSPHSHYIIQQNLYKIALEEKGYKVGAMYLVWLKESFYEIVPLPDITKQIKEWLQSEYTKMR